MRTSTERVTAWTKDLRTSAATREIDGGRDFLMSRREKRDEREAEALANEQAQEAERETETDDSSVAPDENLEQEEEPASR